MPEGFPRKDPVLKNEAGERVENEHPIELTIRPPEERHGDVILFEIKNEEDAVARLAYDKAIEEVLQEEMALRSASIAARRSSVPRNELRDTPGITFIFHQINNRDMSGWEVQGRGVDADYLSGLFSRIHAKAKGYLPS